LTSLAADSPALGLWFVKVKLYCSVVLRDSLFLVSNLLAATVVRLLAKEELSGLHYAILKIYGLESKVVGPSLHLRIPEDCEMKPHLLRY
jgi:hypothetical protein